MSVEEHVALLPDDAGVRGFFVTDALERAKRADPAADVHALAGVAPRRYLPFLHYPYGDYLRLLHASAGVVHPELPRSEALRRLAWTTYDVFVETKVGRAIFEVFGRDVESVLLNAARAYSVSVTFGKVGVEKLGERHVRMRYRDLAAFLETTQVGVVEGAVRRCGFEPEVLIELHDLANADLDVRWR